MTRHNPYNDSYNFNYESPERFTSYYYQVKSILTITPKSVLEIGKGSGIVGYYLRRLGIDYLALDIDVTTNTRHSSLCRKASNTEKAFDVILCAQVLKHVDFELLDGVFNQFYEVCKRGVVISLPYTGFHITFSIIMSKIKKRMSVCIPLPYTYKCRDPSTGSKWGLERIINGYLITEKDIIKKLVTSGLSKVKCFHNPENPHHKFFIAIKTNR